MICSCGSGEQSPSLNRPSHRPEMRSRWASRPGNQVSRFQDRCLLGTAESWPKGSRLTMLLSKAATVINHYYLTPSLIEHDLTVYRNTEYRIHYNVIYIYVVLIVCFLSFMYELKMTPMTHLALNDIIWKQFYTNNKQISDPLSFRN